MRERAWRDHDPSGEGGCLSPPIAEGGVPREAGKQRTLRWFGPRPSSSRLDDRCPSAAVKEQQRSQRED